MDGPLVTDKDFAERAGVIAVDAAVWAARCVWRETPLRDVGIDGQIEYVLPNGVATGRIVAVQVKSGPSYWSRQEAGHVLMTPPSKHRAYWARHPLPVILVLHDHVAGRTIWTDARAQLRRGGGVRIPLSNVFDAAGVKSALASDGPLPTERRSPGRVLEEMMAARHPDPGFRVSYFDLFVGGLTTCCKALYFGVELATETQDVLAVLPGGNGGVAFGHAEHQFIDGYIAYLVSRDLARVDFDAWNQLNERYQLFGSWIVPLTAAGLELVDHIADRFSDLLLVRDRSVSMRLDEMDLRVANQLEAARRVTESPVDPSSGAS